MLKVEEAADLLVSTVGPFLSEASQRFLESDRLASDPDMLIDDILQFAHLEGLTISAETLEQVEQTIRSDDYDPELQARSLNWLALYPHQAIA